MEFFDFEYQITKGIKYQNRIEIIPAFDNMSGKVLFSVFFF